jgi:preprotein translocase subunit SecE
VETESSRWSPAKAFGDAREFLEEVRGELRKVTWPSRQEYTYGTIGVLVIVAILTVVLGVVDFGLAQLIQAVMPS